MEEQKINYTLHLADTNLVLAQRISEWCAHGPILEQDIAITNISLDLLGQARNFYQYAAKLINESPKLAKQIQHSAIDVLPEPVTEDTLAYFRNERDFKNLLITELPNGDWAQTILRQFFYSVYQFELYTQLQSSNDEQIAAIATKSIKETTYHVKWCSEWVQRLGDGTSESHARMQQALENMWPYTGEFFMPAEYEVEMGIKLEVLQQNWAKQVEDILQEATLSSPKNTIDKKGNEHKIFMHGGGKRGIHTEHMGFILAEMQSLQRTYPGAEW